MKYIIGVVLVTLLAYVNSDCKMSKVDPNYKDNMINKKEWYLLAQQVGFDFQKAVNTCTTFSPEQMADKKTMWKFNFSFKDSEGNSNKTSVDAEETAVNSGSFNVSGTTGPFKLNVVCLKKNSVLITQACNTDNGKQALFVYLDQRKNTSDLNLSEAGFIYYCIRKLNTSISDLTAANNAKC